MEFGATPLEAGHLVVERIDLGLELDHSRAADLIARASLPGGDTRLQRFDLPLDALYVRVILAVTLPGLGKNLLLRLQLRR